MSPRQRMINLMYIVLTAMLALNVSSDVLNGFSQVQEGLQLTSNNLTSKNEVQFRYLEQLYTKNPAKAKQWYDAGKELRTSTAALYQTIEELKTAIAKKTDGPDGDYRHIKRQDDLEAASSVMLNPISQRGAKLRGSVDAYRASVAKLITDPQKRAAVEKLLSTTVKSSGGVAQTWEGKMFDNMPTVAAITLLTKLQNDIRSAESEAMANLITNVDIGDVRVNELNAYVIPRSNMIIRGGKYSANIVLAAIDTTQRPTVYVGGSKLSSPSGLYEFVAGRTGTFDYSGYIEVLKPDGSLEKRPFKSSYTVIEPMATVSATMMNVLYAGINNPISISVPGVPTSSVTATMTNGSLTRSGDSWIAHPSKVGAEAVITVSAQVEGRSMTVGQTKFRVRKLPDPMPYIAIRDGSGNTVHYKGTPRRISKAALMSANGLGAAIDDDLLNVSFTVVSFSTVFYDSMGNAIPEVSAGSQFSARQKEQFKRLKPGKSFFISYIKAKGPDGITRDIPPMEVALN